MPDRDEIYILSAIKMTKCMNAATKWLAMQQIVEVARDDGIINQRRAHMIYSAK